MQSKLYSIWIIPPLYLRENLAATIGSLGEKYSTPIFTPHITIASEISVGINKAKIETLNLSNNTEQFTVGLDFLGIGDDYFHCVFVNVKPNTFLASLVVKSYLLFDQTRQPRFSPHLSIMYGNLNVETKRKAVLSAGSIQEAFLVTHLYLYETPRDVGDWKYIEKFPLVEAGK